MTDLEQQQRSGRISRLIAEHEPFGGWTNCDDRDRWALVTISGPLKWLRTFQTRDAVDEYARHGLTGDEALLLLINLDSGDEHVPSLEWQLSQCPWPGCTSRPAPNGRSFLGAPMCGQHTDESYDRDARVQHQIAAARQC